MLLFVTIIQTIIMLLHVIILVLTLVAICVRALRPLVLVRVLVIRFLVVTLVMGIVLVPLATAAFMTHSLQVLLMFVCNVLAVVSQRFTFRKIDDYDTVVPEQRRNMIMNFASFPC